MHRSPPSPITHTLTHTISLNFPAPPTVMPIALEDLGRDGDHKLLIGDLGSGQYDMKLKVFKGEMKIKLYLSLQLLFFLP